MSEPFLICDSTNCTIKLSILKNIKLDSLYLKESDKYYSYFINTLKLISDDAILMHGKDVDINLDFSIDTLSFSIESDNLYPHWKSFKTLTFNFFDYESDSSSDIYKVIVKVLDNIETFENEYSTNIQQFSKFINNIKIFDSIFENKFNFYDRYRYRSLKLNESDKISLWNIRNCFTHEIAYYFRTKDFFVIINQHGFEIEMINYKVEIRNKDNLKLVEFLKGNLLSAYNYYYNTDYDNLSDLMTIMEMKHI